MTANEYMKKIKDNLDSVEQNLEQIQCENAISRQAVLKIIDGWYDNNRDTENIEDLIILITYMSPINPQPKTGHWILTDDDFVYCSECEDSYYPRPIDASWYYCPHCGAKMIDPQESEE